MRKVSEKELDDKEQEIADISISDFDIIHLFGKEKLEEIQQKISKVTGLAFVTVDYKGEPVTEPTYFTEFCSCVRENKSTVRGCLSSDAYGAIQAATTKKSCIYFCPCGLLEVAIPLVVEGHYLGGFIGGQIACDDAPDDIIRLETIFKRDEIITEAGIDCSLKERAPKMSFEQFCDAAELATMVIEQLRDNEISNLKRSRDEKNNFHHENEKAEIKLSSMNSATTLQFCLSTLTTIANLAMTEEAFETSEALVIFADFIKDMATNRKTFWTISEEIDNVERYLNIRQLQLGERLKYSIDVPAEMNMWKIPQQILPVFVQLAIDCGIDMKEDGGEVNISGTYTTKDVILDVRDNGEGLSREKIEEYLAPFKRQSSDSGVLQSVDQMRNNLDVLFDGDCDVKIEAVEGKGRHVTIRYPRYFNERI
jgi:two-component system, LytTR family, sensor kinase